VIGRHSRDQKDKWPGSAAVIRSAYPLDKDISIKILGGANVPRKLLGELPPNWTVYNFNELATGDFLKMLDVYVYFHHREWVEAFSRAVSEAIIAGIPTILPQSFKALYEDACLYCAPQEVSEIVCELRLDKRLCEEVGIRGREKMVERFGPEVHLNRLRNYGVGS
jgi:glycosyltransferase involved in cell wall biosynthesis